MRYRTRWAIIKVCNGLTSRYEKRVLAERLITLWGFSLFWWPVINGKWRRTEEEAQCDIRDDKELRL